MLVLSSFWWGVYMNVACHSCFSVFTVCFLFVATLDVLGFCEAVKSSWFLLWSYLYQMLIRLLCSSALSWFVSSFFTSIQYRHCSSVFVKLYFRCWWDSAEFLVLPDSNWCGCRSLYVGFVSDIEGCECGMLFINVFSSSSFFVFLTLKFKWLRCF